MLTYTNGDLIKAAQDGEVTLIAHQCNCFNNMRSGIAPKIAKAFPGAEAADNVTKKGDFNKLGSFTHFIDDSGVMVVNLYGQFGWWKRDDGKINTEYPALRKAFESLAEFLNVNKMKPKIGLPLIGCGLGGGDWEIVEKIIQETLRDFEVTVYLFKGGQGNDKKESID